MCLSILKKCPSFRGKILIDIMGSLLYTEVTPVDLDQQQMRPIILLILSISSVNEGWGAPPDEKIERRTLFKRMRDAFLEGKNARLEHRKEFEQNMEKMRRRKVFERNVKTLVNGLSKRLKKRTSSVFIVIGATFVLAVWLCHKGSIGCNGSGEKPQSNHSKGVSEFTTGVHSQYSYSDVNIFMEVGNDSYSLR